MLTTEYTEWLRVHNYAQTSVKTAEHALRKFIDWCGLRGITQPKEVTRPILERYQRYLYAYRTKQNKPLKMCTQGNLITQVRSLFKWLAKSNRILFNPASELEMPRKERRLPRHILSSR